MQDLIFSHPSPLGRGEASREITNPCSPLVGGGGEDRRSEPGEGALRCKKAPLTPPVLRTGTPLPQGERGSEP